MQLKISSLMSETNKKIGFALNNITTEQFAVIESAFIKGNAVDLKAGLRFGINKDKKIISILFSTNFIQEKSPFLIIEVGCHFKIINQTWNDFLTEDKTELTAPKGFISHLAMLTIGTARGVLHSKTENTSYNDFLLPTINVADLVKKEVTFNLDKTQPKK